MRNTANIIVMAVLICAVFALALIAISYPTLYCKSADDGTALIPLYLTPWGSSIKDVRLNWFYALRLPFIGLCLSGLFAALLPGKTSKQQEALRNSYSGVLHGLMVFTAAQLSLNPMCTFLCINNVATAIIICLISVLGIAIVISSLLQFTHAAKPLCEDDTNVWNLMLDFGWDNSKKRHKLIIALTAIFMIALVLPSLGI